MSQLSSLSIQLVLIIEISQQLTLNIKKTKFLKVYLFFKVLFDPAQMPKRDCIFFISEKMFYSDFFLFSIGASVLGVRLPSEKESGCV
jgi:hypothetical protein